MARISTHVLDTSRGIPASGVTIDLHEHKNGERIHVRRAVTNSDGRTAEPLLAGDILETGVYELIFHAGDYFRTQGISLSTPSFLDQIVIRFGVADPAGTYHIPLLLSPYAYSTYRGS